MSDTEQSDLPGQPGTPEGEAGPSEADPEVPSDGRDIDDEAIEDGGI